MRHLWNAEPVHGLVVDLHSGHLGDIVLHALLNRHLRDFLLSSAVILLISFLTVATIVLMVTTVNSSIATTDVWSRWTSSSAASAADLPLWVDGADNAASPPTWAGSYPSDRGTAAFSVSGQ